MECDNQATSTVQMLKSGETVFLYYDHLTGEQDQCLERTDSSKTSSSTQASLKSAATQDEPIRMYSIGTQTDHDVINGSTVAMTTRNGSTKGRDTTNIKSFNSTSTETDLSAIGDRKTIESLLRWALAICTSDGDFSDQDAQVLQYSNRNTRPPPSFPQVYQRGKKTSESQRPIDLERAKDAYSTEGNNDSSDDVVSETFREDHRQDGDLSDRSHSSTLGSSNDMSAEDDLIQSMKIEHRVADELQLNMDTSDNLQVNVPCLDQTPDKRQDSGIRVTFSDNLQVNLPHLDVTPDKQQESDIGMAISEYIPVNSLLLDQTPDKRQEQESGMGMAISDHLQINLPHLDQTPDKRRESDIRMGHSEHLPSPDRRQEPGSEMTPLRQQSVAMHVDYHLPGYPSDVTCIKEECVINAETVIQGGTVVGVHVEAIADHDVFDQNVSSTSSLSVVSKSNTNTSQSTGKASPVVSDHSCGMEINRHPENLPNDMERSTQSVERQHECDVCGKRYKARRHLNAHFGVHIGDKPFQCDVCGNKFTMKGNLMVHKRLHSQEEPHACTICTRKFAQASTLKTHMRLHSQEKPYVCTICTKKFTHSNTLKNHMRLHSHEKPYACTICQKKFTQSGHLRYHMSVHTGERPYVCPDCGKGFIRKGDLGDHSVVHSQEKKYECYKCGKRFRSRSCRGKHVRKHTCDNSP